MYVTKYLIIKINSHLTHDYAFLTSQEDFNMKCHSF